MASELLKLYELFEKKLGKEEAKQAIELVEKALQAVRKEAQDQKPILKAELRDELRQELATKEDVGIIEEKLETLNKKIELLDTKIEFVRREMRILFYVLLAFMVLLNKGTVEFIFRVLGLIK